MVFKGVTRATLGVGGLVDRIRGERSPVVLLARAARRWPDRPAVIDGVGTTSFADLHERVRELAGVLHARRIGPGSTVGLLCRPGAGHLEVAIAVLWVDAGLVLLDTGANHDRFGGRGRCEDLDLLVHDAEFGQVVARSGLGTTTLVSDAHGSGSVTAARSFGHPPPRTGRARGRPPVLPAGSALTAAIVEIGLGRPVIVGSAGW